MAGVREWARETLAVASIPRARDVLALLDVAEAARDAGATHHEPWGWRVQSHGNEHVPSVKLKKLRAALARLDFGDGA